MPHKIQHSLTPEGWELLTALSARLNTQPNTWRPAAKAHVLAHLMAKWWPGFMLAVMACQMHQQREANVRNNLSLSNSATNVINNDNQAEFLTNEPGCFLSSKLRSFPALICPYQIPGGQ